MSRYAITISSPARTDDNATIGYDPPLRTYFLQAFENPKTEWPDLWMGTRIEEFPTLASLLGALAEKGFVIDGLTASITDAMATEAARPRRGSVAERYGLLDHLQKR
ncbi:MAG: hypothetical protein J0I69_05105 [Altererythrobacter sp.]|nr:hypothetical protein [Altererythrobacter sp.]OJU59464.1 MAG: hypothetical protein BGO08_03775 [Altererythrobacter sp. 66-12]